MTEENAITALLETFRECKKRGEKATLFLETRNGNEFATFRIKLSACHTPRTPDNTFLGSGKKKSPSTLKRDRRRLSSFRKKNFLQEYSAPIETSTPSMKTPLQQKTTLPNLPNPPLPASCSLIVKMTNEANCGLDSTAGELNQSQATMPLGTPNFHRRSMQW